MEHTNANSNAEGRSIFQWFFRSEVTGSIILLTCTIAALIWANSPGADFYNHLLHTKIGLSWGDTSFALSLHHWINDGLMVIFFFVVGLEIKREIMVGQLSDTKMAVLPVAAAIGGMAIPASLYAVINAGGAGSSGWGVPMATDIAFALGILALFGSRAPIGLKVFLTALAIADDLGAVAVIAVFYTDQIHFGALALAGIFLLVLYILVRIRFRRIGFLVMLIAGVWVAVLASGVHATVAGVLVAFMLPVNARIEPGRFFEVVDRRMGELRNSHLDQQSMVDDHQQLNAIEEIHTAASDMRPIGLVLEHYLHPVQAFLILPLFALFNAGVPIDGNIAKAVVNPVSLGIILGLVVGKQIGILGLSWAAIKIGGGELPPGVTWGQIWGASCLAGVGFTMSLFVSDLAFADPSLIASAKVGVLVASLVAAALGLVILHRALPKAAAV